MATSAMTFQPLSFQQNNPVLSGLQMGNQIIGQGMQNQLSNLQAQAAQAVLPYLGPQAAAQLQQQQLGNALSQNTLNYAPQTSQATLNNLIATGGLTGAQAQAAGAEANLYGQQAAFTPLKFLDPISQMYYARTHLLPQLMSNNGGMTVNPGNVNDQGGMMQQPSPQDVASVIGQTGIPFRMPQQNAPNVQNAGGSSGGMNVPTTFNTPNSYPTLPGGTVPAQQAVQMPTQLATGPTGTGNANIPGLPDINSLYGIQTRNMLMNLTKNPAFGSQRSGAGGTYYDTSTGQYVSSPTTADTTTLQRNIQALQRVTPILNNLSTNLPQFQTAAGQGKLRTQQLGNFLFGMNNALPEAHASAQAQLAAAPESLIRAWGLNPTDATIARMSETIEPRFGESPAQYKNRISVDVPNQLKDMEKQAQQQLAEGIPLGTDQNGNPVAAAQAPSVTPQYSDEDLQYTAKKYGISVNELRNRLGVD